MKRFLQKPLRRVMRNPNLHSQDPLPNYIQKTGYENTLNILEDPENKRKLYLIGSLNASDMLAKRTEKFIKQVNPDSIFVQTDKEWFNKLNNKDNCI